MSNVLNIPVERLVISKNEQISKREYNDEGLQALKDSIKNIGMLTPLYVVNIPDSENYEIVDGYHRFQVAKELDMPEIPCVIASKDVFEKVSDLAQNGNVKDEDVTMVLNALQNTQRQNISFEEMAGLFNTFRGVVKADSREAFFKNIGISEKDMKRYDAYLELSDEQKKLLKESGYEFTEAVADGISGMSNAQRVHFMKTIVDMGVKNSEVGPMMKVAARVCGKLPAGIQTKFGKGGLPLVDSVVSYMSRWNNEAEMESAYRTIVKSGMNSEEIGEYCKNCNALSKIWPEAVDRTAAESVYDTANNIVIEQMNRLAKSIIDKYDEEKENYKRRKEEAKSNGQGVSGISVSDLEFDQGARNLLVEYIEAKDLFRNEASLNDFIDKFENDFLTFPVEIQRCYWDRSITFYPPAFLNIRNILTITTADMKTKIGKVVEILEEVDKPGNDSEVCNALSLGKERFVLELNTKDKDILSGLVGESLAKSARLEIENQKNGGLSHSNDSEAVESTSSYSFEEDYDADADTAEDNEDSEYNEAPKAAEPRKPYKNSRPDEDVWNDDCDDSDSDDDPQASFFDTDVDESSEEEIASSKESIKSAINPEKYPSFYEATRLTAMDSKGKNGVSGLIENVENERKKFVCHVDEEYLRKQDKICEECFRNFKRLGFDAENHCRDCVVSKQFWAYLGD